MHPTKIPKGLAVPAVKHQAIRTSCGQCLVNGVTTEVELSRALYRFPDKSSTAWAGAISILPATFSLCPELFLGIELRDLSEGQAKEPQTDHTRCSGSPPTV